jgi:hypothetical protein
MGISGAVVPLPTPGADGSSPGERPSLQPEPPSPLPKLPPVPDFPLELLPDDLADWVSDAADRARFRPEFAAVPGMAALGSLIGRKLGIRLKRHDDWTEYANVWGAIVGPPSALKSPAMRESMRPFKALQAEADEEHRAARDEYEDALELHKLQRAARRKGIVKTLAKNPNADVDLDFDGDDLAPPVPRTYWTSDATAERLGELLAENPNGLLVERDELSSFLVKLEDETQATARGLYLSGWSGKEGYRFDRIGRGLTAIPKFALSVCGGIQPGPLSRYVRSAYGGERADGLLQRFQLLVWPDAAEFRYVDRSPNRPAKERANALYRRADAFDAETIGRHDGADDCPPFVHLSDEAQALFNGWYEPFMKQRRGAESEEGNAALAAHFGKYPGLVGKLALILHVADDPDKTEVTGQSMLKALAWLQYLAPHAERVYHAVDHPETGAAERLLTRIRRGDLPVSFSARDIYRKCWQGLSERESVKKACRLLCDYGWLIELRTDAAPGGRPADPVYAVSPFVEIASCKTT